MYILTVNACEPQDFPTDEDVLRVPRWDSRSMKAQEIATVCVCVLVLFRLSGVPPGSVCLLPLWRVNPFSLDQRFNS